jgi:hypothetical protein
MKEDWLKGLVRGYLWKARMSNGAVFEWWTPRKVTRTTARKEILKIANTYENKDIEQLWETKNLKR